MDIGLDPDRAARGSVVGLPTAVHTHPHGVEQFTLMVPGRAPLELETPAVPSNVIPSG